MSYSEETAPTSALKEIKTGDRKSVFEAQAMALAISKDISTEKNKQIIKLYYELAIKHQDWKAHRCMRKAAEYYRVKIDFV